MDDQALKYIRDDLNKLQARVERNETKLDYVEDASKGSLSTKEARAETLAFIKADIKNIYDELQQIQKAREKLDDRFFQIWSGIGFVALGVVVTFITSR